jgi:hypothetical protein
VPIQTVYIDNNHHSHFKAVGDSLKILRQALKNCFVLSKSQ